MIFLLLFKLSYTIQFTVFAFAKAVKRLFQHSRFTRQSLILHKICFCGRTSSSCRDEILTHEGFSQMMNLRDKNRFLEELQIFLILGNVGWIMKGFYST